MFLVNFPTTFYRLWKKSWNVPTAKLFSHCSPFCWYVLNLGCTKYYKVFEGVGFTSILDAYTPWTTDVSIDRLPADSCFVTVAVIMQATYPLKQLYSEPTELQFQLQRNELLNYHCTPFFHHQNKLAIFNILTDMILENENCN